MSNKNYSEPGLPTTAISDTHAEVDTDAFWSLPPGKLQVTVLNIQPVDPPKKPYVKLTLGDQVFQTSVSESPTGDWKEGFEFRVPYHTQLFGTCQIDLYDSRFMFDKHVGRAELVLADLENMPRVLTNYYELWDKFHTLTNLSEISRRKILSSNIGAIKIMTAYSYQKQQQNEDTLNIKRKKPPSSAGSSRNGRVEDEPMDGTAGSTDGNAKIDASVSPTNISGPKKDRPFVPPLERQREVFEKDNIRDVETTSGHSPRSASPRRATSFGADREKKGAPPAAHSKLSDAPKPATAANNATSEAKTSKTNKPSAAQAGTTTKPLSIDSSPERRRAFDCERRTGEDDFEFLPDIDESENSDYSSSYDEDADMEVGERSASSFLDFLGGLVIGKETKQVLRVLRRLLAGFGQGFEIPHVELLAGVLILEKFYAEVNAAEVGEIVTDMEHIESPAYYYKFSMAAYGWRGLNFFGKGNGIVKDSLRRSSDALSVVEYLTIPKTDLLGFQFKSSKIFSPSYFYCVDRANASLVLSIRGTMSLVDSLTDLVCEYTPWKGGLAHDGVKSSAAWFIRHVLPDLVRYVHENPWVRSLTIVGHSLGGATAALFTMMLVDDGHLEKFPEGFSVKGYAYGPPCCVSKDLAQAFEPWIDSYVWETDFTSGICYGSVLDFKNLVVAAAEGAGSHLAEILAVGEIMKTSKIEPELIRSLHSCRQQLRGKSRANAKLYLPGRVYHMRSQPTEKNPGRVVVTRPDPEIFTEFAIRRTMLADHLPSTYDRAFTRARETIMVEGARKANAVPSGDVGENDGAKKEGVEGRKSEKEDGGITRVVAEKLGSLPSGRTEEKPDPEISEGGEGGAAKVEVDPSEFLPSD